MTLAEAVAEFESHFTVSPLIGFPGAPVPTGDVPRDPAWDWSRSPTGHRYIAVTNGGVKEEGAAFPGSDRTEEQAIENWLVEALLFSVGRGEVLYWREKPQLERVRARRVRFVVYSRLWVSGMTKEIRTVTDPGEMAALRDRAARGVIEPVDPELLRWVGP